MIKIIVIENLLLVSILLTIFLIRRKILRKKERSISQLMYPEIINFAANFKSFSREKCSFNFKTIFETPEVGFYHFKLKKIDYHKHNKISSLLYIIKGEADGYIGDKKIHAKPGDFIFVPKGVPHHWEMKNPLEYIEISTPSLTSTYMSDVEWL